MKKALSLLLVLVMLVGMMPMMAFAAEDAEVTESVASEQIVDTDKLYNPIAVNKGQLASGYDGSIIDSDIYGYVVNYPLKKGHVLSISDTNYVFSVRKWENGNYSTMLKQATTANYTATEDMTVAMLIRKPDKSAVTAEELADIVIYDSQFGMIGVEGSVKRFTVEAETIDGGTATTRAAIFLPESYSETGAATELVLMTNGLHGHISDSVWNSGTVDDIALMKNYMEAGYAVLVVDNTLGKTGGAPDWGNPQLVSSYWKAYEYVQANLNLEEEFYLHSRSMGTLAAMRIMREHPELIKCAVMCGARLSLKARFASYPEFIAERYGFDDKTGSTWEEDKVIGYNPFTDVDGFEYHLPATFWVLAEEDATTSTLLTIDKIEGHGNDVTIKVYSETDHSGVCRLNIEECWDDAIEYFEAHKERTSEHRFCAWNITPATCEADGEMTRECADCGYTQRQTLEATGFHVLDESNGTCTQCGALLTVTQYGVLALSSGQFSNTNGTPVASNIYGCVIGYELKKGHTLTISDTNYVFAIRQLVDGNYNTLLKSATTDSFTAEEDMIVAIRVRKPDSSTLTADELASVMLIDTVLTITDPHTHIYENGICTGCGAEHPNLANYEGKVISILGGSTCTFDGYIPVADGFNLTHRPRYPQSNLLTDVNDTWWMQVVAELDAKLGINDSWAGSQVLNTLDSNSGDLGPDAAMASLTRIQNLGANGTPDIILFYGAMNDIGRGVALGSFDAGTAPSQADLTATKWSNLADAYVAAILRMQHYYPNAEIVAMLPGPTASYYTEAERKAYCEVLKAICDHYGVPTVDLSTCGLTTDDMPDGTHPNAEGMDYITAAVLDTLLNECQMEADENLVHSVTHELTGAKSSLSYYKGVSDGKSFVTTITGEDVAVTVTMGGIDITNQVYSNGKISISAVTGDIVITAKGKYNADGRLQQLPENYCCDTNLWTTLDPVNEYYTTSGWGNNSNSNYSVTFPVTPGDQIWATSFGAAGTNGYSANAVRITWFDEDGVLKSLGRDVVYAEFAKYGYITVPQGAMAVNIPMASDADTWKIYILNRDHTYENGTCTGCGAAQPGPVITQQPVDGEAKLGERYMVEVLAEGEGLTYQWYGRNAGSKSWFKSSVKDNTYDDVMTEARAGREVYCVITDANGNSVTTDIVKLICIPSEKLEIVTQPTDGEAVLGERFCVTVEAKGEGLKYQWYFRNKGATNWSKSSVTDNTYDDIMNNTRAGREVYCVITDRFGNKVTTDIVKLVRVPMKLEITSQPTDAEAAFGEMFCATVEAKGEGLKYQWYYRNAGSEEWHKSGVRDNTYDDVMTKARNGREIYCVITDKYGNSVTTDIVKLIAVPKVELKLLEVSYESAAMGGRFCVTVEAEGDGLTYTWYFRNEGATRWSKSGVTDNTYDDVMNKTRANREVYCVITDAFGNQITTEVITLEPKK